MARSGKQVSQWALRTFLKTVRSGGLWPHPERVSWWMNRELLELHGLHGRRESLKHILGDGGITCPGLPLLTAPTLFTAWQDVCEPGCHSSPPQMLVVWECSLLSWLGLWITAATKVTTPTLSQWLPCSLPLVHRCLREGWDRGGEVGREMKDLTKYLVHWRISKCRQSVWGANVFIREPWKGTSKSRRKPLLHLPMGSPLSQGGRWMATDVIFSRAGPLWAPLGWSQWAVHRSYTGSPGLVGSFIHSGER